MKRVSLLFLLMALISSLFANDLLKSKAQSPYTYYYQISNKEAAELYKGKTVKDYYKLLHTKVDSFLTSKFDTTNLNPGHYLLTKVSDNQVRLELKTIQDFYLCSA